MMERENRLGAVSGRKCLRQIGMAITGPREDSVVTEVFLILAVSVSIF
jgi:hypothetical protein